MTTIRKFAALLAAICLVSAWGCGGDDDATNNAANNAANANSATNNSGEPGYFGDACETPADCERPYRTCYSSRTGNLDPTQVCCQGSNFGECRDYEESLEEPEGPIKYNDDGWIISTEGDANVEISGDNTATFEATAMARLAGDSYTELSLRAATSGLTYLGFRFPDLPEITVGTYGITDQTSGEVSSDPAVPSKAHAAIIFGSLNVDGGTGEVVITRVDNRPEDQLNSAGGTAAIGLAGTFSVDFSSVAEEGQPKVTISGTFDTNRPQ